MPLARYARQSAVGVAALCVAIGGGGFAIAGKGPITKSGEIKACYVKEGKQAGKAPFLVEGKCKKSEKKLGLLPLAAGTGRADHAQP